MAHNGHDHKKAYLRVWAALLILTAITVKVAYYDFGIWNTLIAMLVATIKASLVVLIFMHLKYDNRVNQVVFTSAFVFLLIFIGLTAADLFYRPIERAARVEKRADDGAVSAADIEKYRTATPELIEHGKTLFASQCATCHGGAGMGDGAAAAALNPKPRNLTVAEGWKLGRAPSQVFKTLSNGSPGTAMASFSGLPAKDRWALVHYVRTLGPNPPDDTSETIAALTGGVNGEATKSKAAIPIPFAMALLTQPEPHYVGRGKGAIDPIGGQLYQQHCAQCHGPHGEGGIKVRTIGVAPYAHVVTQPLMSAHPPASEEEFIKTVSKGMPGFSKPGIAHFTMGEWHALYEQVKSLSP